MKNFASCARLAALPLALAAALPSFAQTELKEVVVTASRVAIPVTDVIADVSIIDRTALNQAGQSSLRDVLAQQPGVQLISNGGYRSTTGIFLRGALTAQSIVLIDGIRVGSATSGGAAIENIPLERVERIEILRGAASALYGPDAVGGVIQIFTRGPSEMLEMAANVGVGSDGQRQAGASIRGSAGAIGYSLGVSSERASGMSVIADPASYYFNPDADEFKTRSVDAKLSAKLSDVHAFTLGVLRSETDYQFDGAPYFPNNSLALTPLTSNARALPVLNNVNFKWEAQWQPNWKSTLTLGRSDDDSVSKYYRVADGVFGGSDKFNTSRTQASLQNDISLGQDVLTFLLENRAESVDSSTNYSVKERDVQSVLLSYALNRQKWNALAVLRNDRNSQFGSFENWALSGGYKLTGSLRAVASVGTSFQAPDFNQLYYPDYGTPTLTPQQSRASEIGLKYQQGGLSMGAVAYHNKIQGFIDPATNFQSKLATLSGVTLSAQLQMGATNYSVSYDYADPKIKPSNQRFVRIANNVLNLSANHRWGNFNAFGELKLSSDREDNNLSFNGRETLAGYGLLNVGLNWKVQKDLTLLARINNLTDAQYTLGTGYSVPGRNVFVSLSWAR